MCRIVLLGILIAYIAAAVFKVRDYTGNTVGTPFTVWPSWGWIIAIIASVLWFLAGIFASCEPPCSTPDDLHQTLCLPVLGYTVVLLYKRTKESQVKGCMPPIVLCMLQCLLPAICHPLLSWSSGISHILPASDGHT